MNEEKQQKEINRNLEIPLKSPQQRCHYPTQPHNRHCRPYMAAPPAASASNPSSSSDQFLSIPATYAPATPPPAACAPGRPTTTPTAGTPATTAGRGTIATAVGRERASSSDGNESAAAHAATTSGTKSLGKMKGKKEEPPVAGGWWGTVGTCKGGGEAARASYPRLVEGKRVWGFVPKPFHFP